MNKNNSKQLIKKKTKIIAITGNRADYDLLSYLYVKLNEDKKINFSLIVTGGNLLKGYENVLKQIGGDKIRILEKIKNIKDEGKISSRPIATGILIKELAKVLEREKPDLFVVPGDREEVIASAVVCAYEGIPLMHFFGGDFTSTGHVDNTARLSASKYASFHIVTKEDHKRRLLKLGEKATRIFNIGSPGLDKFRLEKKMSKKQVLLNLKTKQVENYALLIYHPSLGLGLDKKELLNILDALKEKRIFTFVSYPNTDYGCEDIVKIYDKYRSDKNFYFYKNFNRNLFINLFRNASFQIGNSSSGISEAASIPLPVINIGIRQKNRGNSKNIIHISNDKKSIAKAIDKALSKSFVKSIKGMKNPFGDGKSTERAYKIIKKYEGKYKDFFLKTEDPLKIK